MNAKSKLAEKLRLKTAQATPELPGAASVLNRLDRAENTVKELPTGFSERQAPTTFTRESSVSVARMPYYKDVPLEEIDENPFNARKVYSDERITDMSLTLAADGQLSPGIATIRNGRYVLAAGHYRYKGLSVAKMKTMSLMIHEGLKDEDLYKISFLENEKRNDQSALDNALAWRELLDNKVYSTESHLSQVIGISSSNINKTLQILNLPSVVIEYMKENNVTKFPMSPLYELVQFSKLADATATLKLVEALHRGEVGRKEITLARLALENPKVRKQKETSRQYKIFGDEGGQEIGHVKEFGSGKVLVELNIPDEEERKRILDTFAEQFHMK